MMMLVYCAVRFHLFSNDRWWSATSRSRSSWCSGSRTSHNHHGSGPEPPAKKVTVLYVVLSIVLAHGPAQAARDEHEELLT